MRVAQELINKPVISIKEGKELGKVQGFYTDQDIRQLTAVNLGSEGLFGRDESLIKWADVATLGEDAILVEDADCVMDAATMEQSVAYRRRSEIVGRRVDTPGGTRIGTIGDLIIDDEAVILGFSLPQTYVAGPIAGNKAISRSAIVDTDGENGVLTALLADAEKANLQVTYEGFFAEPAVNRAESPEAPLSES